MVKTDLQVAIQIFKEFISRPYHPTTQDLERVIKFILLHLENVASQSPTTENNTKTILLDADKHFHQTAEGYTGLGIRQSSPLEEVETENGLVELSSDCAPRMSHSWGLWTLNPIETPASLELRCSECGVRQWFELTPVPVADTGPSTSVKQDKPGSAEESKTIAKSGSEWPIKWGY